MPTSTDAHKKQEVENILNFLTPLPIFQHLEPAAIQAVAVEMVTKRLPEGHVLFTQGDPGDAFYIVISG